ncbi:E3 ubiquitin-protein ligase TRAIP-like [Saccostrea cucullata]|uniref:E3 ubiquitin-protein ligase TRAIP-like n=1 Tax=Saccostrea cuccullata TaxID=36930 RepID=UPI002ED245EE
MKAQCCICAEHFINDPSVAIAAVQCGHTFHEGCLSTWLKNSNTCPSCRSRVDPSRVINRLFFDGDDDSGNDDTDVGQLKNTIQSLQADKRTTELKVKELNSDNESLQKKLKTVKKEKDLAETKYLEEQSNISSLKKQLQFYQVQQKCIEKERETCSKIKQKFSQYQNIERLLTACEVDIKETIQQYGDSSKESVQNLATYCSMLKREYDKIKFEKKNVKSEFEKFKRENMSKDHILQEKEREITHLKEQLAHSEEDLKKVEKEKHSLKRKILNYRKAVQSPNGENVASVSFVDKMMSESPFGNLKDNVDSPVLFDDSTEKVKEVDLEEYTKKSVSPEILKSSSTLNSQNKRPNDSGTEVKYLKIGSASQKPVKRQKCDDLAEVQGLSHFNIFKKKSGVGDYSSSIRKGFNGLGCVETFTEPSGRPKFTVPKRSISRVSKNGKMLKVPSLPTLDNFVVLD